MEERETTDQGVGSFLASLAKSATGVRKREDRTENIGVYSEAFGPSAFSAGLKLPVFGEFGLNSVCWCFPTPPQRNLTAEVTTRMFPKKQKCSVRLVNLQFLFFLLSTL